MTEIKLPEIWRERLVQWTRDLIIVFGMWSIWLINVYMVDSPQKTVVTVFIALIIGIIIGLGEHYRTVDYTVKELEAELREIKSR